MSKGNELVLVKKLILLLSLVLIISGCTVRVAYNYMDWYLAWKVDDFVELNDEQEVLFDKAIDDFKRWHKSTELPKYKVMLEKLELAVEQKQSSDLAELMQSSSQIWKRSAEYIAPSLIILIESLTPDQKQQLIDNIAKQQSETHTEWQKEKTQSQEEQIAQALENMEERLGELSSEQQQRFRNNWLNMTSTMEMRIKSRQVWLAKFKQAILQPESVDQITLFNLFTDISSSRSANHMAVSNANQTKYREFIAKELTYLTEPQKQKVLATIRDYIADVTYLINS